MSVQNNKKNRIKQAKEILNVIEEKEKKGGDFASIMIIMAIGISILKESKKEL